MSCGLATTYIKKETVKMKLPKWMKWKKIEHYYLYETDEKQYITERYISRETFCFYNPFGDYKCKEISGYQCRHCGHIQRDNNKPCERCGW